MNLAAVVLLADSAAQVVQDWRVIGIVTVGGIVTLWIKQRGDSKKLSEVKEQVSNNHTTNLRDDVTKGLKLMEFTVEHVRDLPTKADVKRLNEKFDRLDREHRELKERFKRAYPEPGD